MWRGSMARSSLLIYALHKTSQGQCVSVWGKKTKKVNFLIFSPLIKKKRIGPTEINAFHGLTPNLFHTAKSKSTSGSSRAPKIQSAPHKNKKQVRVSPRSIGGAIGQARRPQCLGRFPTINVMQYNFECSSVLRRYLRCVHIGLSLLQLKAVLWSPWRCLGLFYFKCLRPASHLHLTFCYR